MSLDIEQIRERYRQERDRRARPSGTDQFQFAEGELAQLAEDPYADELPPRNPVDRDVDVLVIGCGIGGIEMAATLRKAGVDDILMVDGAADFGGTWYWNRYPGIRCDVESYIYLPYLEETGYMPTERYARGSEIFEYLKRLAQHLGLYERARLQTRVTSMEWDAQRSRWHVRTNRGDTIDARFVTHAERHLRPSAAAGNPWHHHVQGQDLPQRSLELRVHRQRTWNALLTRTSPSSGRARLVARSSRSSHARRGRSPYFSGRRPQSACATTRPPIRTGSRPSSRAGSAAGSRASPRSPTARTPSAAWTTAGSRFFRRMIAAEQSVAADRTDAGGGRGGQGARGLRAQRGGPRAGRPVHRRPEKAALLKAYYRTLCKRPGFSDEYLPALDRDNVQLVDVEHRRSRSSRRTVSSSTAWSTRSTASCWRPASSWAPPGATALATTWSGATACVSRRSSPTACAPTRGCSASASPTCSSPG